MSPADRETIGEKLSAYLDGELPQEQQTEIEELLKSDAEARSMLSDLRKSARVTGSLPRESAPPEILESILNRIERSELLGLADDQVKLARHRGRPLRSALAVAAMVVIAIGGGIYVSTMMTKSGDVKQLASRNLSSDQSNLPNKELKEGVSEEEVQDVLQKAFKKDEPELFALNRKGKSESFETALMEKTTEEREANSEPTREWKSSDWDVNKDDNLLPEPPAEKSLETRALPTDTQLAAAPVKAELQDDFKLTADGVKAITPTATSNLGAVPASGRKSPKAPEPDLRTLEQKFVDGETITTISSHRFNNEPLQLKITFGQNTSQNEFSRSLHLFLAENNIAPLPKQEEKRVAKSKAAPGNLANLQLSLTERGTRSPASTSKVFYDGQAFGNYQPQIPGEQQLLLRVPSSVANRLVDLAVDTQVENISFNVGLITANGHIEAKKLANNVLSQPTDDNQLAAATSDSQHEPIKDDKQEISNSKDSIDLIALLQKVGLAPDEFFNGLSPKNNHAHSNKPETRRKCADTGEQMEKEHLDTFTDAHERTVKADELAINVNEEAFAQETPEEYDINEEMVTIVIELKTVKPDMLPIEPTCIFPATFIEDSVNAGKDNEIKTLINTTGEQ